MEINFKGKRALVTGAASGIGRGIAIRLGQLGAKVVALDVSSNRLGELKNDIPNCETATVDLSNWDLTKEAVKKFLPIDLLVNNVGMATIEPITDITEELFLKTYNLNVKPIFIVTQTVVEDMLRRNAAGSIVNISSQTAKAGLPLRTLYSSSKGAIDAFTRSLAAELGQKNIRVNSVNPTVVMTELGARIWSDPEKNKKFLERVPVGRFAEIEDVVNSVVFLLSEEAGMVNGHQLAIDGGFLAC